MLIPLILISATAAKRIGGFGLNLDGMLELPFPELGVHQNVVAEESEKMIAAIEKTFAAEYDLPRVKNAVVVLSDIALSFNTSFPKTVELDILAKLMQTIEIESSVSNMKIFVAKLPRSAYLKASIRVYKAYVDLISRGVEDLKSTEEASRLNGVNLLFNAFPYTVGTSVIFRPN